MGTLARGHTDHQPHALTPSTLATGPGNFSWSELKVCSGGTVKLNTELGSFLVMSPAKVGGAVVDIAAKARGAVSDRALNTDNSSE